MNRTHIYFLVSITLLLVWHVWSLPYSPLPWFDETFFASITHSFINGKGFLLEVCPMQTGGEPVLTYGPVYFFLTGITTKLFGFGIVTFRLVNLLGGIISITLFYAILRNSQVRPWLLYLFTLLLSFDVLFIQNAHSGRMDLVALAFFMAALHLYLLHLESKKLQAVIGLLGTLAVLTTLRIAVIVVPFFALIFINNIINKKYKFALLLLLTSVATYIVWIYAGFGSISAFISEYISRPEHGAVEKSLASRFLGGNFYIPFYHYPLVIVGICAIAIIIIRKTTSLKIWLTIIPIPFFYLLVKDTGAYSAMVVPFWYLAIARVFNDDMLLVKQKKVALYLTIAIIGTLFIVNVGIFALKATTIIGTLTYRNPKPLEQWVKDNIPAGSNIVGDDRYFYALTRAGSKFQYIERIGTDAERAAYHKENFMPNYLFISSQTAPQIIEAYTKMFVFSDSLTYIPNAKNNIFSEITSRLPMQIQSSYEGILIKLEPKN